MNHGRDFFMQEYRKVVLLCESWSQYHLSYSTSSLRFVPCDQPQEKRENGTTFFLSKEPQSTRNGLQFLLPFQTFFYPKNGGNLIPVHLREVDTIYHPLYISYTHNAIRHYCIFSFFIVCHLLGAYHYVRKRLPQHKARVQPRSIPLRQKNRDILSSLTGRPTF